MSSGAEEEKSNDCMESPGEDHGDLGNWNQGFVEEMGHVPSTCRHGNYENGILKPAIRYGKSDDDRQGSNHGAEVTASQRLHEKGRATPSDDADARIASLTPSKTGVKGRAIRVEDRRDETVLVMPSQTKFTGILKKLEFPSTVKRGVVTPGQPVTATKKLHFGGETPAEGLPGTVGENRRRVTFGGSAGRVVQPVIEENEGYTSEEGDVQASSVNSKHAGSTPFDRRLSSLFSKYAHDGGTPGHRGDDSEMLSEIKQDLSHEVSPKMHPHDNKITREYLAAALKRSLKNIELAKLKQSVRRCCHKMPWSCPWSCISPTWPW